MSRNHRLFELSIVILRLCKHKGQKKFMAKVPNRTLKGGHKKLGLFSFVANFSQASKELGKYGT
ncbi:hypothetical protein M9194_11905 [Vibrio sp. S4M6]|uniref:hypothetical protein n=1 Tax=Vibrio sinus TaxID=2946865 RepID=UPI00202AC177|nr:hypothetical protein [Vibrio sinus]MCL9782131.1 hypothetical protein [Vibrio sinus]